MRQVRGHAVAFVCCAGLAACGGRRVQVIDPVTFVASPASAPTTVAPRLVSAGGDHAAVIEARHDVAATVVASPEFARALASLGPLAIAPDAPDATDVGGAIVAARAYAVARPVVYRVGRTCGGTTASTALTTIDGEPGATITLYPVTIERLRSRARETTGCAVNTLVHEWSHVARGDDGGFAYVDTGRGATTRPLVSYTAGAVAQCVYLAEQYRGDAPAAPGFALERCITAAAAVPLDPSTCEPGWGEQFVSDEREGRW